MNELELDDQWQRSVFDRLLKPILREHTYEHQIVFLDINSQVASLLQRQAHVDAVAQLPAGGTMSIEIKIVRWPGAKEGRPGRAHWKDLFLETWSCTVRGHEQRGWMSTSIADYLLWCQCSLNEDALDCWAFPFTRLRNWHQQHTVDGTISGQGFGGLPVRSVKNVINGRALWTRGDLAPINKVCRDLRVTGFQVREGEGLVRDFWGQPILHFLRGAA